MSNYLQNFFSLIVIQSQSSKQWSISSENFPKYVVNGYMLKQSQKKKDSNSKIDKFHTFHLLTKILKNSSKIYIIQLMNWLQALRWSNSLKDQAKEKHKLQKLLTSKKYLI